VYESNRDSFEKYRAQQALSAGKARIGIGDDLTTLLFA
jgi:hypothetical protein